MATIANRPQPSTEHDYLYEGRRLEEKDIGELVIRVGMLPYSDSAYSIKYRDRNWSKEELSVSLLDRVQQAAQTLVGITKKGDLRIFTGSKTITKENTGDWKTVKEFVECYQSYQL